jgi:hypothetical protein
MNRFLIPQLIILLAICPLSAQTVTLDNSIARMDLSLKGGIITGLRLNSVALNPIHEYGHFICFDRWGPSSPEDQALGIPWHGEGSSVTWALDQEPVLKGGYYFTEMSCLLPIVKLGMDRKIYLDEHSPVFRVVEQVSNHGESKRVFNLVQHSTIGPPFLDETTIVDTEVDSGFSQAGNLPPASGDVFTWPEALVDGIPMDLRYLSGDQAWWQAVVTFILDEAGEYSWVTAVNPSLNLMLGYIWPTAEYPWLNFWVQIQGASPFARGLEFGTTGLHQPWPELLQIDTIFGKKLYKELDVEEKASKSYYVFLSEIPADYRGVESVTMAGDKIVVEEYGLDPERSIELDISGIPDSLEDVTSIKDTGEVPSSGFGLRNYPNPFLSSTTISFDLPEDSHVDLTVYDMSGRVVETLVDGNMAGSRYHVQFNPGHAAGTTFINRLTTDHAVVTRKMVLIK